VRGWERCLFDVSASVDGGPSKGSRVCRRRYDY
jgi:hypothetical protein